MAALVFKESFDLRLSFLTAEPCRLDEKLGCALEAKRSADAS